MTTLAIGTFFPPAVGIHGSRARWAYSINLDGHFTLERALFKRIPAFDGWFDFRLPVQGERADSGYHFMTFYPVGISSHPGKVASSIRYPHEGEYKFANPFLESRPVWKNLLIHALSGTVINTTTQEAAALG
jgi:hypothetical protein